ncbi:hypothetical protein ACFSJY_09265 [Thalassotalea euphylliae]|uniref:hypothetical protein n=1 Tax=Thalassotalea euphylliae TaxID=1655234 RepID=UPI0036404650
MPLLFSRILLSALFINLLISMSVLSANHEHHSRFGTHGMALMKVDQWIIASHMPLQNSMHDHQIIFTTKVDQKSEKTTLNLLENNQLVSIVPEKFDLVALIDGTLKSFNASVVAGHFERGGKTQIAESLFVVDNPLMIADASKQQENGTYQLIELDEQNVLAIHKIAANPSFDHIVWLKKKTLDALSSTTITTSGVQLNKAVLETIDMPLTWQKQLYLETKDFQ